MNSNYFWGLSEILTIFLLISHMGDRDPSKNVTTHNDSLSVSVYERNSLRLFYRVGEDVSIFYLDVKDSSVYRMDSYNVKNPKKQKRFRISHDSERTLLHKEILSSEDSATAIFAEILPWRSPKASWMQQEARSLLKKVRER